MNRLTQIAAVALLGLCSVQAAQKPNVVLIVCDDLNDYITHMKGHPQAKTPNVERLAQSGVAFKRAYSNSPVCAPSRSSFLTGIYPHTSGNLFWDKWFQNPILKNSRCLMEHFKHCGYHVVGSGKLMHHAKANIWDEFPFKADYGPFVFDGKERTAHPSVPKPFYDIGPVDGSFASLANVPHANDGNPKTGWIYGTWGKTKPMRYKSETDRDPTPDERNAKWAAERIKKFAQQKTGKPFFLGVGFIRPHTPLHVPQKYFDLFPLKDVKLPVIKENDAEDCHYKENFPEEGKKQKKGLKYFRLLKASYPNMEDGIRAFTQAYLASVSAVDDCIGTVVDAIDNSPFKDNTIVVLTSDHGWNMGEKDYLFKNSLWEESARVPLVIRAPGVAKAGGVAEHPVSLIDIYPTLVDLCGLKKETKKNAQGRDLDGHSLRPFLVDPKSEKWDGRDTALTMVWAGPDSKMKAVNQHWSVRTKRWRYIRYRNGAEELYDHDKDEYEWTNLANNPEFAQIKKELKAKLLKHTGLKIGEQ